MNILLTGAQGFTGRHFAESAMAAGHDVAPLQANLLDVSALKAEVSSIRPDAVVHLAGISFVGHAEDRAFYDVNLFGTLNLLDALAASGHAVTRVLLASSANVYGNCEDSPIAESQPPAPVNHYAMSKLAMEHLARSRARQLPLVFARPFNYTGSGQSLDFVVPKIVDHFLRRAPRIELGNLHVEREFNDVRSVCQTYLQLLQHGMAGETYNICTGITYSLGQVMNLLSRLTGHVVETQVNPAFVRPNEIFRLCGCPLKLESVVGKLAFHPLEDTLSWMLADGAAH